MSPTPVINAEVQLSSPKNTSALQYLETLHLNCPFKPSLGPSFKILPCEQDCYLLSDELNHRILKFDPFGELIWQTGGKGGALGNFWYPRGLAIIGSEIFVCDSWNHRIQVLNSNGRPLRTFGTYGSGSSQFNECSDIEADSRGRLWIADTGNHCLKVFKSTGDLEETFGRRLSVYEERAIIQGMNPPSTEGFAPGFCFPRRFLANYGYSFCVDDRGNQRVCLVTCDGRVLAALDARQTQVTRYSDDASLKGISGVPIARLRLQLLEVVDWNGVLWQSVPASRFSEVNSSLVQVSGKSQLLVYYYNWTTQNLIKYALVLSIGTLGAGGIDRNSS